MTSVSIPRPSHTVAQAMADNHESPRARKRPRTDLGGVPLDVEYQPLPYLEETGLFRMSMSTSPAPDMPDASASPIQHSQSFMTSSFGPPHDPQQSGNFDALSSMTAPPTAVLASRSLSVPAEFSHMTAEEYETYETCVGMQEALKAGKSSAKNYSRHVAAYEKYWLQYQHFRCHEDSTYVFQPAHPITATKVAIFLKHECERPKVSKYALKTSSVAQSARSARRAMKAAQSASSPLSSALVHSSDTDLHTSTSSNTRDAMKRRNPCEATRGSSSSRSPRKRANLSASCRARSLKRLAHLLVRADIYTRFHGR